MCRGVVLVVEDDPDLRAVVIDRLRCDGYEAHEASSVDEGLRFLESGRRHGRADVDVLLVDVYMPGRSGLELVEELRRGQWNTSVIVMTGFPDRAVLDDIQRLDVQILAKPFAFASLREITTAVLAARGAVQSA